MKQPGSGDPQPKTKLQPEEVLGFERKYKPTILEINAAFRKRSVDYHPDKPGGSAEKMSELTNARDELKQRLERSDEPGAEEDNTIERLAEFIDKAETLDALIHALSLFNSYTEEQLVGMSMPTRYDQRAVSIFRIQAHQAKDGAELQTVRDNLKHFGFYEDGSRPAIVAMIEAHAKELSTKEAGPVARSAFLAKVRGATLNELDALREELYRKESPFNKREKVIIRTQMTRRYREVHPRWGTPKKP